MAGGANYVLDKGYLVLSTYDGSSAGGVIPFRPVKFAAGGTIDAQTVATAGNLTVGVVQEKIDQSKVAQGKAIADVRLAGITKAYVADSGTAPALGDPVIAAAGTGVTGRGVVKGVTATNVKLGICVGPLTG